MKKATVGALTAFCLGAALGYVSYSAFYDSQVFGFRWNFSPATPPTLTTSFDGIVSTFGLIGIAHIGGLAAIAGAAIGGAGAIVEAIRENRRFGIPLGHRPEAASAKQDNLNAHST